MLWYRLIKEEQISSAVKEEGTEEVRDVFSSLRDSYVVMPPLGQVVVKP